MKIIVIGDIHGHDSWKKVIKQEQTFDKIVFLGDYWDSFSVNSKDQKKNYIEIQKFRDENPNKIITLLGNHDFHYLYPTKYSGWKSETQFLASPLLEKDIKGGKLPFIYRYEDIVFSHAGITNYWLEKVAKCSLQELEAGEVQLRHFDWNSIKGNDPYGDTISNSPLWVRPYSLKIDSLEGYRQVVGHTHRSNVSWHFLKKLFFCDALPVEYIIFENNEFKLKNKNHD